MKKILLILFKIIELSIILGSLILLIWLDLNKWHIIPDKFLNWLDNWPTWTWVIDYIIFILGIIVGISLLLPINKKWINKLILSIKRLFCNHNDLMLKSDGSYTCKCGKTIIR